MNSQSIRVATKDVPEEHRVEVTREVFGRQFMRVELEQLHDAPLNVDLRVRNYDGLRMINGTVSGARTARTSAMMSDGNDDIFLTLNQSGSFHMSQRGHDVFLRSGDAQISACNERFLYLRPKGSALGFSIPRKALASRVKDIDEQLGRKIPREHGALALLQSYAGTLEESPNEGLEQLAISHIYDLVALGLCEAGIGDVEAQKNSVAVARLAAIKAYIREHLHAPDFAVGQVAAWQHLSPRQVQRLFETEGKTFSEFLQGERLTQARSWLEDAARRHQSVNAIAFACGFRDISSFNRAFRRRYGATPSEIRNRDIV